MRTIAAALVVGLMTMTTPVFAQDPERSTTHGGGKGALIGLLVGAGAAVVYGVTADYCRNPVGEYTEQERAQKCLIPIAGMVGGGALAGYFIGRHKDARPGATRTSHHPLSASLQQEDLTGLVPPVMLKQPAREPRPEDRFFRRLFTSATMSGL